MLKKKNGLLMKAQRRLAIAGILLMMNVPAPVMAGMPAMHGEEMQKQEQKTFNTGEGTTNVVKKMPDGVQTNYAPKKVAENSNNLAAPLTAMAQTGGISGEGTASSPYLIASAEDLAQMRDNVNANLAGWRTAHYRVTADIDLKEIDNWIPIGTSSNPFLRLNACS